jgi:hypothetical protein
MSSRFTIDTNILRIRDVFAFNPANADFIQSGSVPVIGTSGKVQWLSSLQFLSTISIPSLSTNILGILEIIQPGLSSLSTAQALTLISTVEGLGSSGYVSTSGLYYETGRLSLQYGYISSTTLVDCIAALGNMDSITGYPGNPTGFGPMAMFPAGVGKTLGPRGYVSTLNPGEYHTYRSTVALGGGNLTGQTITNSSNLTSAAIDIGGYTPHFVNTSKLRVDIAANLTLSYGAAATTVLSSFLVSGGDPIGSPVRLTYSNANLTVGSLSFLLNATDLASLPTTLELHHVTSNASAATGTINTFIPEIGGIHVTLDNTD